MLNDQVKIELIFLTIDWLTICYSQSNVIKIKAVNQKQTIWYLENVFFIIDSLLIVKMIQ